MSKKKQREYQAALLTLHVRAQNGTEEVGRELRHALRVRDELLLPHGRFGRRHEHPEPYRSDNCGWCSNIHSWRRQVALLEAATPLSEAIEAQVKALAAERTQAALWAAVQATYPRVRRDLVRQLWRQVRGG